MNLPHSLHRLKVRFKYRKNNRKSRPEQKTNSINRGRQSDRQLGKEREVLPWHGRSWSSGFAGYARSQRLYARIRTTVWRIWFAAQVEIPQTHRLRETDSRSGGSSRHHSISEYDGGRSGSSAGLQGYYAGQRFPPRPQPQNDQDQALQAKRRIAAQRERELRNYHQEQQYNKS